MINRASSFGFMIAKIRQTTMSPGVKGPRSETDSDFIRLQQNFKYKKSHLLAMSDNGCKAAKSRTIRPHSTDRVTPEALALNV